MVIGPTVKDETVGVGINLVNNYFLNTNLEKVAASK